jgi:hypothetical protein
LSEPRTSPAGALAPALPAGIAGIGVVGPGLRGWAHACSVLGTAIAYEPAPTLIPPATALPPAERRRTGRVVNLALAVGQEAIGGLELDLTALRTVFASSGADSNNCHEICQTLASTDRQLSPTRFHNSVHNVAAGYWSIATRDMAPYTVVCAYDGSFAAGLLEALVQVNAVHLPVLLVAYDVDYPPPLRAKRPIPDGFGVALLLQPDTAAHALATVFAQFSQEPADMLESPALEQLRGAIPAARCLPLLERIARRQPGLTHLAYLDSLSLALEVTWSN